MENKRALILAIVALAVSILLVSAYLDVREKELTKEFGEPVDVVIAGGNFFDKNYFIPEYTTLQPNMLLKIKVFKNYLDPNTVSDPKDLIGKSTFVPIHAGEQITLTKLISKDGKPLLDRQLEKKMRAVTISVSPQTGVGKLIRPGNRVDVMITPSYEQDRENIVEVKTLIPNVVVLATGRRIQNDVPTRVDRDLLSSIQEANEKIRRKDILPNNAEALNTSRADDNYQTVTLQLPVEDAEKLVFLTQKFGDKVVYLTLRNTVDASTDKIPSTILEDVLGPDSDYSRMRKKPLPVPEPKPRFYDYYGTRDEARY